MSLNQLIARHVTKSFTRYYLAHSVRQTTNIEINRTQEEHVQVVY